MSEEIFSIKNKVVIITGGGQGIGEFLALEFSKRDAIVYCIYKTFNKSKKRHHLFDIRCDITKLNEIKKNMR